MVGGPDPPTLTQLLSEIEKEMWTDRYRHDVGTAVLGLMKETGEQLEYVDDTICDSAVVHDSHSCNPPAVNGTCNKIGTCSKNGTCNKKIMTTNMDDAQLYMTPQIDPSIAVLRSGVTPFVSSLQSPSTEWQFETPGYESGNVFDGSPKKFLDLPDETLTQIILMVDNRTIQRLGKTDCRCTLFWGLQVDSFLKELFSHFLSS